MKTGLATMLRLTFGIFTVAMTMLSSGSMAQTSQPTKWLLGVRVMSVEPASGGWVWVRLEQGHVDCSSVGGPASIHLQMKEDGTINFTPGSYDRIYSTLLTAVASGRTVDINVTGSSNGSWCLIERVRFG